MVESVNDTYEMVEIVYRRATSGRMTKSVLHCCGTGGAWARRFGYE